LGRSLRSSSGCGVDRLVGAGEIRVAGESIARLAVDYKTDLFDAREVREERADDGVDGERLDFDAGRMVIGKGASEVDNGELPTGVLRKRLGGRIGGDCFACLRGACVFGRIG